MTFVNEKSTAQSSRERQKEETRKRVYEAALEVFRRDGVAASSIDDVARLAGVSRGTFYFHFPTKEDVLAELLREGEAASAAAIEALPARASATAIAERLVSSTLAFWQGNPQLLPEVGMVALRLTITGVLTSQTDPVRAAIARRFAGAVERGELTRAAPPAQLGDTMLLGAFAALMSWAQDGQGSLEARLRRAVRLFLDGARTG
jgi:AcrR family transcriptional regulator